MLRFHARTDVGLRRKQNEDAMIALPNHGVFAVADGVGGRKAGELASAITIDTIQVFAPRLRDAAEAYGRTGGRGARQSVLELLEEVANTASARIYETAQQTGREGMTTTLVVAVVSGASAFVAHVGDSRAYLLRAGDLRAVTEDHSLVNDMVRNGGMTPEEAETSRYKNVITRALGLYPQVNCDTLHLELVEGDRLFLCSDGLSDMVRAPEISALGAADDLSDAVEALVDAALRGGGKDNITLIGIDPNADRSAVEVAKRAHAMESLFLFQDLSHQARLRVGRIFGERTFRAGEVVFDQGAPGDAMFVLIEGEVSVRIGGREVTRIGATSHFGELALVDDGPRSATVVATAPVHCLTIERDALREWTAQEPGLGARVLWRLTQSLAQRLRDTNTRSAP
jgi:serine/threonine protein phosphatase PrpC